MIRGVPSLKKYFDKNKKIIDNKILLNHSIAGGLKTCDIFIPELDLVIEFDGPTHYF